MRAEATLVETVTDGALLQRYVEKGDQEAFEMVVGRHRQLVKTVCARCLWGPLVGWREDAEQTVLLILARKATDLRGASDLSGWLHQVCTYTCNNLVRSDSARTMRERYVAEEGTGQEDKESDRWQQVRPELDAALMHLSERYRDVILQHHICGKSCAEIARQKGCSENAVRIALARGRLKLRNRLARKGVVLSAAALVAGLDSEVLVAGEPSDIGHWSVEECNEQVCAVADAVMTEMDRAAAKTMWWKVGAAAVGVATVGVGTALVVSHLRSAPTVVTQPVPVVSVATTSWRIESLVGAPIVRRVEKMQTLKAGDLLCIGDTIMTSSNQEVQVTSDGGSRILVREEGDVRFEHPTLNTEHRTSKLGEGDSRVRVVCGAIVAELKSPVHFATPHAAIQSDTGSFFLMVASGVTSNRVPWSFSRLDVTEGQTRFRSSEAQVSSFDFPVSSNEFAAVGTDQDGKAIGTVARKSDGVEVSPKYGGGFYREFVEQLERHGSNGMFSGSVVAQNARVYSPDEVFQMVKRDSRLQSSRVEGGVSVEYQGGNPPLVLLPPDFGGASEGRIVIDWSVVDISPGRNEFRIGTPTREYVPNPAPPPYSSFRSGTSLAVRPKIGYRTERRFRRAGITPQGVPIQIAEETMLATDSGTLLAAPSCGWETGDVNTYMLRVQNMKVVVRGVRVEIYKSGSD